MAAGYGTRLSPLTDELPKPLLPVLGRPLLARTLDALAAAGCEAVAINLHHLPDAIPAACGERHRGMPLVYSREEAILGTGGAFGPLRDFFAPVSTALLVNGDSLCDWPLAALLARHRRRGTEATLLLAGRPDPRPFGGGIGVDPAGRVTAIR
ncbi:MAG TPA: nucleotidyltransferase family protein, partial [Thermoanaerobaculia bacterium]|nr:nucleotidyltransferase family protein [Thermoanaerobaculia bacterium]